MRVKQVFFLGLYVVARVVGGELILIMPSSRTGNEERQTGMVASSTMTKVRWARRVSLAKIRRLYESDAQGMLDEDLLSDVGYGIYYLVCFLSGASEQFAGFV